MQLVVQQVLETATPYTPSGKTFSIREWTVLGSLDGSPPQQLIVRTFSGKPACQVVNGWSGYVEEDVHNGFTKYKIPTPRQGEAVPPAAPPPLTSPAAAAPTVSHGNQPYTFEQLIKLHDKCMAYSMREYPDLATSDLLSMTHTLLISCQKERIRAEAKPAAAPPAAPQAMTAPPADPTVNDDAFKAAIVEAGLQQQVKAAKLTFGVLRSAWAHAQGDSGRFISIIRTHLPAPAAEEELPW